MKTSITCIKNGIIVDRLSPYHLQSQSIYIQGQKIIHIGSDDIDYDIEIDVRGDYISSGWMDLHTHVNPSVSIGLTPDQIGVRQGVTLVVDAGSCGASNIEDFMIMTKQSQTKVKSILNISTLGLATLHELTDTSYIDNEYSSRMIEKYRKDIVGIKVRASQSVMGDQMDYPFEQARKLADKYDLPIMVHIGNAPPTIDHVLTYLNQRDIITHCFHGKPSKIVDESYVLPSVINARNRGVKFDVGHGSASFNFLTYQQAIKHGLTFETISSDLHTGNYHGPVYSLSHVMDKMVAQGLPFDDVVYRVTREVANVINLKMHGQIEKGFSADLTRFQLRSERNIGVDADGNKMEAWVSFVPKSVWVDGKEVLCDEKRI